MNSDRVVLNGVYFFRVDTVTSGKPIKIYKVLDFESYKVLCMNGLEGITREETILLKQVILDNEEVYLSEGDYLVDSATIYWEFSVDSNKNLSGASYFKDIVEGMAYDIIFKDGVAISGQLALMDVLVSKFVYKNEVLCISYLNDNGDIDSQTEVFVNLINQENVICTSFYKSGQVKRIENSIEQSISSFFENGNLESVQNLGGQWSKFYEESGLLLSEMYYEEDKKIVITYFKGVIVEKMILSDEENSYYQFKEGVLSSYKVCNNATDEIVYYGEDGHVIGDNMALQKFA